MIYMRKLNIIFKQKKNNSDDIKKILEAEMNYKLTYYAF